MTFASSACHWVRPELLRQGSSTIQHDFLVNLALKMVTGFETTSGYHCTSEAMQREFCSAGTTRDTIQRYSKHKVCEWWANRNLPSGFTVVLQWDKYIYIYRILILILMDLNDNYSQDFTSPNFSVPWGHGMRWQVKHQPGIAGPRRSHKGPAESPLALVIFGDFWMSHDVSIQTGTRWGTECRIIIDTGRLDDI